MADEAKTRSIAVAGIMATALVGIVGTTGSWLISRDDRANQRSLARASKVYDRRADTYLAALRLIEQQRLQILGPIDDPEQFRGPRRHWTPFVMAHERDGYIYARVVAFGSDQVIDGYKTLRRLASRAEIAGLDVWFYGPDHSPSARRLRNAYNAFDDGTKSFQLLVQRELA